MMETSPYSFQGLVGKEYFKYNEIAQTDEFLKDELIVNKQEFIQTAVEEVNETQLADEDKGKQSEQIITE